MSALVRFGIKYGTFYNQARILLSADDCVSKDPAYSTQGKGAARKLRPHPLLHMLIQYPVKDTRAVGKPGTHRGLEQFPPPETV